MDHKHHKSFKINDFGHYADHEPADEETLSPWFVRVSVTGDQQGFGMIGWMVHRQARELAYLDIFYIYIFMEAAEIPLVFFMKKAVSTGEAPAH